VASGGSTSDELDLDELDLDELPLYVALPAAASDRPGHRWPDTWRSMSAAVRSSSERSIGAMAATAHAGTTATPCFGRLIDLPGMELARVLPRWWARDAREGVATVDGHLLLWAPMVAGATWTLHGRLRHGALKGVPVSVDLWPHSSCFTRLTMNPQVRVATSKRYFAVGNRALDTLARELARYAGHLVPIVTGAPGSTSNGVGQV